MSAPVIAPVEPKANSRMHRVSVRGEELLVKVREIIQKGNARRIIVINEQGDSLLEIPLTAGVKGAIVAPVLVFCAIAAPAQNYTLLIEAHVIGSEPLAPRVARPAKRARQRRRAAAK